jgi:predicted CXXCH cytochrome family protein
MEIAASLMLMLAAAAAPPAQQSARPKSPTVKRAQNPSLAPVKGKALSVHSPFEVGDCSLCHERKNPKHPGKVTVAGDKGCYVCHEDFELMTSRRFQHATSSDVQCVTCHNPHNANYKSLLVSPAPGLCLDCHTGIAAMTQLKSKHSGATLEGKACVNCHNPHASNVEHLLAKLPFDLCVNCHSTDDIKDSNGAKMTNIKKLLEDNKVHHGPVAQKDCSACHLPHGSNNFDLLSMAYPSTFYAPFEVKSFELCFSCHEEQLVTTEKTTTATRFRDGDRNLHFLHCNKADRGRTCRACHEIHAAQKTYQIRDSVPYGSKGYLLKVSYEKRPDGGNCTQTCHTARSYTNASLPQAKAK